MSERSVEHGTFVIERNYEAAPERAFAGWADRDAKAGWFVDSNGTLELDFRVGGRERSEGITPSGDPYTYRAVFLDIVENERIVYAYEMSVGGMKLSVSLATVEFRAVAGGGTHLVFTEQGAFLDGHEPPAQRADGMGALLDLLGEQLLLLSPPGP